MEQYFNLEYLNTFLIAADTGKLNITAELTYRSHSAVSTQIKKLEELIGTPLFIRNKNTLTLTRGGELLYTYAKEIINTNHIAFKSLTGKTWDGNIGIGIPTDYAKTFMQNAYPRLKAALPNYQLTVDFSRSREIRKKIGERKLDIGMAALEPQYEDDILLWEEPLMWVCHKEFQLLDNDPFPVAIFSDDCIINNHSLHCLKKSNINFRIVFTSKIMDNLSACVQSCSAISLLPESIVTEDMLQIPNEFLSCPFTLKIGCTWNPNTDKRVLNTILDTIQDCFDEKKV